MDINDITAKLKIDVQLCCGFEVTDTVLRRRGRYPLGMILGENWNDQSVVTDDQQAYDRWLTRTVIQTLSISRSLPRGYAAGSISSILIGFAKANLDGHDLSATDLIAYAQGNDNTALRYIALLEKDGWIEVSPLDPDRRRLTEAGHIMVRKMWQRCSHLYETD